MNSRLYIKNMVCNRCKLVVKAELEKAGIAPLHIDLGEVELSSTPQKEQLDKLLIAFRGLGFELIDDRKTRIIEKIKSTIITLVHHSEAQSNRKLSTILSEALKQDYRYVSNLFSSVEGITIEKYYINQRVERIKELLVYDELSLSQISDRMGYSSVAYLSGQFKKVTGFTPSHFKGLKVRVRNPIG